MSEENVGVEALRDNGGIVMALIRFQAIGRVALGSISRTGTSLLSAAQESPGSRLSRSQGNPRSRRAGVAHAHSKMKRRGHSD